MTAPIVPFVPLSTQTPSVDWTGNLRDVIDTQQQTIKFLLGQWDALNAQVAIAGGEFGAPIALALNALVPAGWWQTVVPTTAGTHIADATINSTVVPIYSGLFWSDGNVKVIATAGITVAQVAVMEPTA
jgi:hypothetical protein